MKGAGKKSILAEKKKKREIKNTINFYGTCFPVLNRIRGASPCDEQGFSGIYAKTRTKSATN